MIIVTIVHAITRILAGLALLFAIIAYIAGNTTRGKELLIGAVFWFGVSIVLSLVFWTYAWLRHGVEDDDSEQDGVTQEQRRYSQLVATLQQIKEGNADDSQKITISSRLIRSSGLPKHLADDLIDQVEEVYASSPDTQVTNEL